MTTRTERMWIVVTWIVVIIASWFMLTAVGFTTAAMYRWYTGTQCAASTALPTKPVQRRLTTEQASPDT